MERDGRVVVVGAGLAGVESVRALRTLGHEGPLVLLGDEPHQPYDRPPLSKGVLAGLEDDPRLDIDLDELGVQLRTGVRATRLRPGVLETSAGELAFDGLVLAVGARPVPVPHAVTVRTLDDARALRSRLVAGARVVVVGAGWIGAEVASAAAAAGCEVVAVEALAEPLAGALPVELAARTRRWWSEAGVRLRTGTRVAGIEQGGVRLEGDELLAGDVVVVATGVRPATGWLAGSGVELDVAGGVVVDEGLRTSLPAVVAAGDCASFPSRRYGRRLRIEHWDTALHAPEVAAASLLGQEAAYDPVPYVWSDQFGRTVQCVGHLPSADRWVPRETEAGWCAFGISDVVSEKGPLLVAAVGVGLPRDVVQARRVIERSGGIGPVVDEAGLTDPAVQVRSAVLAQG
ncbi:MAG: NAD(P)/FAD-dependent oxidoreductase [Motilibacteraceae bacterium]